MTIHSLLYISESTIDPSNMGQEVEAIVRASQVRNQALQISGALVATRNHFAQVLEGRQASVDELMVSISRDRRHTNIQVIATEEIPTRFFPRWSLAYLGSSSQLEEQMKTVLKAHEQGLAFSEGFTLINLMKEMAWMHGLWKRAIS